MDEILPQGPKLPRRPSNAYSQEGGGGVLSLKKGTNCSPTIKKLFLSRVYMAEKGVIHASYREAVKVLRCSKIVDHLITILCLYICLECLTEH